MKVKIVIINLLSTLFFMASAQEYTQTIRGKVVEVDTHRPLFGVNVLVVDAGASLGAATDADGYFSIPNVGIGRVSLRVSYLGYQTCVVPNVLVGTGKETYVEIQLQESLLSLNEVVIKGGAGKGELNNEMVMLSARQVTVEETQRFAGSLDDPSRMVSSFAGVTSDPMGNNDIVVRGNSPKGILWKLEGVDIPNPNHFSDEGTTGGPINALSSNMLANSDFYTGAFAPQYGNAISGIFDVQLRTGNNKEAEFTAGIGVLGTDIAAEGPFKKGYNGSYLINYRYSSLAMLDDLGVVDFGGVPEYQDLSFKVCLPSQRLGSFCVFGLGRLSAIDDAFEDSLGYVEEKSSYNSYMGVVGLNHLYHFSPNTFVKTTLSTAANGSRYNELQRTATDFTQTDDGYWDKTTIRASSLLQHKINNKHLVAGGLSYDYYLYDMKESYREPGEDDWINGILLNKNTAMLQAYTSWKYRILPQITMVSGLHYSRFMLNNAESLEPRLAINWQFLTKHKLSLGYGRHSMVESIISYYGTVYEDDLTPTQPNVGLDLTRSDHYVLGYENRLSEKLNTRIEVYYQKLHSVPVENVDTSYYSLINQSDGYVDKALVNQGNGYNYGIEFTFERFFYDAYYFMATASLYDSKYKALDGKWRNTRYNGNYALNFLIGKEFNIGKPEKGNILNLNTKVLMNGGNRYIPINIEKSQAKGESVFDFSKAFENRLDHVFQLNFTASYTINRPKVRHEIYLDIYNVLNNQARIFEYYDQDLNATQYDTQLGMIPNIIYKLHF